MKDFGKWILSGGLALAGISAPMAAAFDDPGFYVGAHFGSASAGDWCGEANKMVTGAIDPRMMGAAAAVTTGATPAAISFENLSATATTLTKNAAHVTKGTSSTANGNLRLFAESTYTSTATTLDGDSVSTSAACGEDSGTSSGIFVGYRMNSNFAFEFATNSGVSTDTMVNSTFSTNPGVITATAHIFTSDGSVAAKPATVQPTLDGQRAVTNKGNTVSRVLTHTRAKNDYTYSVSSEGETSGMVISALGFLPIGSGWQVYGRLGLNMWDGSTDYTATLKSEEGAEASAAYMLYYGTGSDRSDAITDDTATTGVNEAQDTLLATVPQSVVTANNGTLTAAERTAIHGVINGNLTGLGGADALYFTGLTPNGTALTAGSNVKDADNKDVMTSTTWKEESSGTGIVIGVGVEWIVSETLGLRGEYTQYGADDGYDLDGLFLSAIWKF